MTLKELFECGLNYESYIGTGSKSERLRIPKNYNRINLKKETIERISKIKEPINFLCVGEMWCPDCQLNLTSIKRMTEINTELEISVISKGRGGKYLLEHLNLDEIKIPTVAILNGKYELIGKFIEQPNSIRGIELTDEENLAYLKGKHLEETIINILDGLGY